MQTTFYISWQLTLEKQHEANPLIVFVVLDLIFTLRMRTNTGLNDILSNNPRQPIRNGERRINPTICVHNIQRYLIDDAIDGVANVLSRRNQKWKGNQNDHRRFVVQAKYVVVDADLVELQQPLHGAKNIKHVADFFSLFSHFQYSLKSLFRSSPINCA